MDGFNPPHGEDPWSEGLDSGLETLMAKARHASTSPPPPRGDTAIPPSVGQRSATSVPSSMDPCTGLSPSLVRIVPAALFHVLEPMRGRLSRSMRCPVQIDFEAMSLERGEATGAPAQGPTVTGFLQIPGCDAPWLTATPSHVLYPWIDRMLLQGRESEVSPDRPLTQLELKIAARAFNSMLDGWKDAWSELIPSESGIEKMVQVPGHSNAMQPGPVVAVSFQIRVGSHVGCVQWMLPVDFLTQHEDALASLAKTVDRASMAWKQAQSRLAATWPIEEHEVTVALATIAIPRDELAKLEVGDIISLDQGFTEWLDVEVDGHKRFLASPGSARGRKAIKIEKAVD